VLFICTANGLEGMAPALVDRLEKIEIEGYALDEKLQIARGHLLPKQLASTGWRRRAAGERRGARCHRRRLHARGGRASARRELTKICRAVTLDAARHLDGKAEAVEVGVEALHGYLGKPRFFNDVAERAAIAGVATGLAWTPAGGDICSSSRRALPGKGKLEITGHLGDVMKESAQAALTYVRSTPTALAVDPGFLAASDLHIHVPAGATPKDGPSRASPSSRPSPRC